MRLKNSKEIAAFEKAMPQAKVKFGLKPQKEID